MRDDHTSAELPHNLLQVEAEIDRFYLRRFAIPRFSRDLESLFQGEQSKRRVRQLTIFGLVALVIYNLFLVSDYLIAPDRLLRAVAVRLGIVTPIALLITWRMQRKQSPAAREASSGLLCLVACGSVLFLHHASGFWSAIQSEGEVFLVLLTVNAVLRIDLLYACLTTTLCYLSELAFLLLNLQLSSAQKLTVGGRVFWVALFTLFANYVITREHRNAWLLRLRSRIQHNLLSIANANLISLSATDRLTGLANRHAYEERLITLWNNTADLAAPLSAVMVDVDHFKSINDDFGHSYGDRVLQRVATLLQQGLRVEDDFVARIGGEEFIVLLPGSDAEAALLVAERIRTLVQVAGSPAFTRNEIVPAPKGRWSTVSCGVATTIPSRTADPQILIDDADSALYRAKQTGRNRVCCTTRNERPEARISLVRRAL